ncbi:MAG: hypothetical protein PHO75_02640 [Candidatus Shapirobacteria bacterium]|jgi:hypothetical protein|nr:hypothetical protein [Candidatus Shapirobacteria bacterium]
MDKERVESREKNIREMFRKRRERDHAYWGNEIRLGKNEEDNIGEIQKEDEINNKVLKEFEVEKFLKEAIEKNLIENYDSGKAPYIHKKEKRSSSKDQPVYISLIFNEDEKKRHWSEVRIAVLENTLCLVRHKARGDQYNYYPIEKGKLEETIARGIRHPMKWNLNCF